MSGQVDIFVRSLGQADLWSDVSPSSNILWPSLKLLCVRLTCGQMYPPCSNISWQSLELLKVRLTFGQMYPPVDASSGQECYYVRSG